MKATVTKTSSDTTTPPIRLVLDMTNYEAELILSLLDRYDVKKLGKLLLKIDMSPVIEAAYKADVFPGRRGEWDNVLRGNKSNS